VCVLHLKRASRGTAVESRQFVVFYLGATGLGGRWHAQARPANGAQVRLLLGAGGELPGAGMGLRAQAHDPLAHGS